MIKGLPYNPGRSYQKSTDDPIFILTKNPIKTRIGARTINKMTAITKSKNRFISLLFITFNLH